MLVDLVAAQGSQGPTFQGLYNPKYVLDMYHTGLHRLKAKAHSDECKARIEFEYMKYMTMISEERPGPFEDIFFHSQCERTWAETGPLMPVGMRSAPARPQVIPPPLPNNATKKHPDDIKILYVMLIHDHASLTKRLLRALDEPQHTFVVHVDLKAPHIYEQLQAFASHREGSILGIGGKKSMQGTLYIMDTNRQSVTWGGFSVVNATLSAMRFAWERRVQFDYMIDISGTTYPLVGNKAIRTVLAQRPGFTYMDVHERPSRPSADMWHSYVECDDNLHRISRLSTVRGMNMFVGSQWFALPWHVVHWFLHNLLPIDYITYAKRVVVSDEHYFATLFKNSPYCDELVSQNLLFVLFDKWENEKTKERVDRDKRKCLHPDPDHCGRSPTTLTLDYRRLLQTSQHLFARKFDPKVVDSLALLDEIDKWRENPNNRTEGAAQDFMVRQHSEEESGLETASPSAEDDSTSSSGIGSAKCLSMESKWGAGKPVRMVPCNASDSSQWFTLGRCSGSPAESGTINLSQHTCGMFVNVYTAAENPHSDKQNDSDKQSDNTDTKNGSIEINKDRELQTITEDSMTCQLRSSHVLDPEQPETPHRQCLDISGEDLGTGARLIGWDCTGNWNQLFHFAEDCTLSAVQPKVIAEARSLPHNITRCIESTAGDAVQTSACPEITAEGIAAKELLGEVATMPNPSPQQKWQVLPRDGTLWKRYDTASPATEQAEEEL